MQLFQKANWKTWNIVFIYRTQEDKAKPFFKHQGVCHSLKTHKLFMGVLTREMS